jgi:hypothetical protein
MAEVTTAKCTIAQSLKKTRKKVRLIKAENCGFGHFSKLCRCVTYGKYCRQVVAVTGCSAVAIKAMVYSKR